MVPACCCSTSRPRASTCATRSISWRWRSVGARSGTAVVAVLHDLNLAIRFADRIIVLRKGTVAADGSPTETITDRMIADVFDVETSIGTEGGQPYVLLQRMQ